MSSFARENLIRTIELAGELPPQAHRAFLHLVDAEYYLEELEKYNFEVFSKHLNSQSYFKLPLRMQRAAKTGKFFTKELKEYI